MNTLDILKGARELYASAPSHAQRGHHPAPGCYCPVTALDAAAGRSAPAETLSALEGAASLFGGSMAGARRVIIDWNAHHTTGEVLAAFDRAIAELAPKGWAIFFVGKGSFKNRISRVATGGEDLSNLWPGDSPADAAQRLRDRFPGVYEDTILYVGSRRGEAGGSGCLMRVHFEMEPARYTAVQS